jgi:hypothetical protein
MKLGSRITVAEIQRGQPQAMTVYLQHVSWQITEVDFLSKGVMGRIPTVTAGVWLNKCGNWKGDFG